MADKIAALRAIHDPVVNEITEHIEVLAAAVLGFCEVHKEELTASGKTTSFGTGEVCWRQRPWSVSFGDLEAGAVVDMLLARKLKRFVRIKKEIDKRAILAEREKIAEIIGDIARFERGENFVIKPFGGAKEDLVLQAAKSA